MPEPSELIQFTDTEVILHPGLSQLTAQEIIELCQEHHANDEEIAGVLRQCFGSASAYFEAMDYFEWLQMPDVGEA